VAGAVGLDQHLGAGWNADLQQLAIGAVALGALAVATSPRPEMRAAAEMLQVAQRVVADEHDVSPAPAVPAVGAALGHVGLAPEAQAAITAGTGLHVNSRTILHRRLIVAANRQTESRRIAVVSLLTDFKKFLFRGNVVDLAVAVVIGTAFAAVVKALVADILTPIIALIFGQPNFENLSFTINSSHFLYGDFINNLITFISIAAVVFFFVVKPVQYLMDRRAQEDPSVKPCPECTSDIPLAARRCPMCTAVISETPGGPGAPSPAPVV
jgi:large conductance mechanosensitive channel